MLNEALLEEQMAGLPVYVYAFLDPGELEFSPRVRWVCAHECPMYGRSWACPPGVGTVEACREKCLSHSRCLLISSIWEVEDISDLQCTLQTRGPHEALTDQVAQLMRRQQVQPYILSTEACSLCPRCSFLDGEPCRMPEKMHPCIESHGINLIPLLERLGLAFQYGGNVVTWFSLLFYN